jgi:glycosyltransferase involved in cell wall biosynthesis
MPTRGRGATIEPTLRSLRRQEHDSYEVIVVDQSVDDRSEQAYRDAAGDDPRFHYVRSGTAGKSVGCNVGIGRARGRIIAFTDDDCVAPPNWLLDLERALRKNPSVDMVCAGVRPGPYDPRQGAIPSFLPRASRLHRSPWLAFRARGIGANICFRTGPLRSVSGFDEVLGAGGPLRSGEDLDIVYRMLRAGLRVLDLPEPAVIHHGLRRWGPELRTLSWDSAMSEGAVCMKHLRMADAAILPTLLVLWFGRTVVWTNIMIGRRPTGVGPFLAFGRGMLRSFLYPLERRSVRYRATSQVAQPLEGDPERPSADTG